MAIKQSNVNSLFLIILKLLDCRNELAHLPVEQGLSVTSSDWYENLKSARCVVRHVANLNSMEADSDIFPQRKILEQLDKVRYENKFQKQKKEKKITSMNS